MKKLLGKILQWTLLGILCLSIPSAMADSINTIAGSAALDQSSPRVWRHGTSALLNTTTHTTAAGQYGETVKAVLYGCDGTCATLNAILFRDPNSDGVLTSDNHISTASVLYGFNGTTFDRLRTGNTGDADTGIGKLHILNMLFNATDADFERMRVASADTVASTGLPAAATMYFDGTTWNRGRSASADGLVGGAAANTTGIPAAGAMGFNGTNWNRHYTASSTFHGIATTGSYIRPVIPWSQWGVTNTPAAATQATASRAAGAAGVVHVATTVTACFSGTAVNAPVQVNLRDGASGAGTVLRSWLIGVSVVNGSTCENIPGLAHAGTAATAMTLEFAAAGGAGTNQTVTLSGYSTVATTN